MIITSLHLLLTYQCNFECDHCFVWGSPSQTGVMTLPDIHRVLEQAKEAGDITSIYFEGGEPFLYYATLLGGVREAARAGFETGIVSNAYWATSPEDALTALKPFAGLLQDLTVSSDLFHSDQALSRQVQNALQAAQQLGIPTGEISIARPEALACSAAGQLQHGDAQVMYRGRAAVKLAGQVAQYPWEQFDRCPHEDLRDPGRVHLDPFGNVHICQGIIIGNFFHQPLQEIFASYDPDTHPICGPLLHGGPVELTRVLGLSHADRYADACHLCYETRLKLRQHYPAEVGPNQMFGIA